MTGIIADRLDRISPSQTIAMRQRATAMKRAGRDVPRFRPGSRTSPRRATSATLPFVRSRRAKPSIRMSLEPERCARRWQRNSSAISGIEYAPEEVIVSTGGKQVIFNAMLTTIDPGDEVVIPTPTWVSYPDIAALAEGKPVLVPCAENNGFRLRAEDLEAAITPRTKWFILNNPCNPTGVVYTADDLRPLCDVLLRNPNVWIFTDDIYEKLAYDGVRPATIAQAEPRLKNRTVTMNGCSKSYAMTGWRMGFAGAPIALIRAMDKLQGQSTASPSSITQAAALAALSGPQDFIREMVATYRQRRDLVVDMLNTAPGVTCHRPQGAFYVFPSIRGCIGKTTPEGVRIETDESFVMALLQEAGVAAVHGGAFLAPGHFRISYAADTELLRQACHRIQAFCAGLR